MMRWLRPPIMNATSFLQPPHPLPPPRGGGLRMLAALDITQRAASH